MADEGAAGVAVACARRRRRCSWGVAAAGAAAVVCVKSSASEASAAGHRASWACMCVLGVVWGEGGGGKRAVATRRGLGRWCRPSWTARSLS